MDPFLMAAGSAVVGAMASEGWKDTRQAIAALWRKARPEQAPEIEADLELVRSEVLAARRSGDRQAEEDLAVEWRSRLRRLVAADERLADELRRIVDGLAPPPGTSTVMITHASGKAQVYNSGRDMHLRER